MGDWCDQLLAGLRIPPDSVVGIDDYCTKRGWKADDATLADDATGSADPGATCVTIWPADTDLD